MYTPITVDTTKWGAGQEGMEFYLRRGPADYGLARADEPLRCIHFLYSFSRQRHMRFRRQQFLASAHLAKTEQLESGRDTALFIDAEDLREVHLPHNTIAGQPVMVDGRPPLPRLRLC